jgi:asparagine synthase (glutamine-hydrolysing)
MSGIVGILRTDLAPVDPRLIRRLTQSLSFRGPDAQQVWADGPVAFGHTLLRTTEEAENEHQPFTLDREVWIVADCRVDARSELIGKLDASPALRQAPDVELILRAYLRWGESCVEHLLGDFAFAIWDGRSRRLFCARDHFGVKPFFYAHRPECFVFSNTLDCVRRHPAVSDRLDDLAIADFLLFDQNQNAAGSAFADIRRLPPAHTLVWSDGELQLRRYWTLPIDEPVYLKSRRDYVEQFRYLLRQSVRDRLRTDRVTVFMSGGLDSPLLAATARDLLDSPSSVSALTCVYDHLIPDNERHYAGLVARHLGIPIHFHINDDPSRVKPRQLQRLGSPEPVADPWLRVNSRAEYCEVASRGRVALYGEGPDNALYYEWRPHLECLFRQGRWPRLVSDVCSYLRAHRRIPVLLTLPGSIRNWRSRNESAVPFPAWLNDSFSARLDLPRRWIEAQTPVAPSHPVRPVGYRSLQSPLWQSLLEDCDAACTGVPVETRHPYLDLRLIRFMLSVPSLPWCMGKHLLREAARGVLPEEVRRRPKTPLSADPLFERSRQESTSSLPEATPALAAYVDLDRFSRSKSESTAQFHVNLRLQGLHWWLRGLAAGVDDSNQEIQYELTTAASGTGNSPLG